MAPALLAEEAVKYLVFALFLALQVAEPPEPYPGQRNHAEPPEGCNCHNPPIDLKGDQAKWCGCERTCDAETQVIHADKECLTWCWEHKHCDCPMAGDVKRCMPAEPQ